MIASTGLKGAAQSRGLRRLRARGDHGRALAVQGSAIKQYNTTDRLDIQPDLFGGVLLAKEWGRIGAHGRTVAERYDSEALAADALQRQAERKRRRRYTT